MTGARDESAQKIGVLLADDHALFREALRAILSDEPNLRVAGETGDGGQVVGLVEKLKPEVLLLDSRIPTLPALDILRQISERHMTVRTLLVTAAVENFQVLEALRFGLHGVIFKGSPPHLLVKGIRAVVAGEYWIDHQTVSELVDNFRRLSPRTRHREGNGAFGLSRRELDLLARIVYGYTNKDLASEFAIGMETVKHHLTNIYRKVGVANRFELALFAMNHGLVKED